MQNENHYLHYLLNNPYPRTLNKYDCNSNDVDHCLQDSTGKHYINFSSNDYLGLSRHPLLLARSYEFAKRYGTGVASSRLVTGNISLYEILEEKIANALGKPAALILASGYQTNISILEALFDINVLGKKALVFCDRYCHISMLSATQHNSHMHRFKHNDIQHLKALLEKYADSDATKFILIESLYSMDGDETDLQQFIILAKQYKAYLYVDDAHAVGIYGRNGWGKASDVSQDIDFIMGTFSKALGSFGAYLGCSHLMRDYFINKCRGLIYSTGLSPAILGAISGAIEIMPSLEEKRLLLQEKVRKLSHFFKAHELYTGSSTSHIIPWIFANAEQALMASFLLKAEGILATCIRPPSVPVGSSRIRFCISASHSDEQLEKLQLSLLKVKAKLNKTVKQI
jgi:8-amino-7-oxononanoate synthase